MRERSAIRESERERERDRIDVLCRERGWKSGSIKGSRSFVSLLDWEAMMMMGDSIR
jgi:hypothetical protein